jgi:hypothetical protein
MLKSHKSIVNIHKACALFILGILFGSPLYAQNQTFRAGLILGLNLAQVDGDNYVGYGKFGLHAGGVAELPLSKRTSLSFELLYEQKGAYSRFPQNTLNQTNTYKFTANYANVPILFMYYDRPFVCFSIGPAVGQSVYESTNLQGKVKLNTQDISAIFDARYFMTTNWVFGIRYAYSLSPVGTYDGSQFAHHNMYNNTVTLRFMYMFGHRHTFDNQKKNNSK